ncbi:putative ferric reductase [Hoeflea marina]|uniref:Putative ferric reductase n=1 Tax=Hoeflea marina TaxID=274592 RepID=A0A317PKY7_9HYPH|nr:ferredoxin reductase family protein [Hoeflea marina]PWW01456.1 putative ferric reductase [Hoeflea marina]
MGILIIFLACLVAMLLSVPAASHAGLATWFSIASASTAFVAMAVNQYLATRPTYVEPLFGGLDRIYRAHKWTGIVALGLILAHYVITPNFKGKLLTTGLNDLARLFGEIGFYGLMVLGGISVSKRLPRIAREFPYHLWRQLHRFIGVFFIAIAIHFNFIKRPFDGTAWLAIYLNVFAAIGIASYIQTQLRALLRRRRYRVVEVDRAGSATLITAEPVGRGIRAAPGQFAFIAAHRPGLREAHPFTIAGHDTGPDGVTRLTFVVKPLGDFTRRLRERIAPGDTLMVEGGYGRFSARRGGERQLWVAGGIGVTPFLAMARSMADLAGKKIHLVYCVRDAGEAIGLAHLDEARKHPQFSYTLHSSAIDGRVSPEVMKAGAGFDLDGADLWYCGPAAMRQAIVKGFRDSGVKLARVEFERFEFR